MRARSKTPSAVSKAPSARVAGPRQKPLVTTKLHPPATRGTLLPRPRLLELLRQTLERKFALVHGPAGFGKTTLAAQWYAELRAGGQSASWLSTDASDNDINRFLAYLVEALRSAEPDIGRGLREVIEANPGSAVDHVIDALVNDLAVHDTPFVLFLDDWHLVREPDVHEALHTLIARSPANLHVVVTSRTRGGVPLARLRVQNELVEIDAAQLRFDLDESHTYLTSTKALALPDEDVQALWRSTEGWAAALQLASLSLRECGNRERILHWTSGASNDISDYLAENVVNALPPDLVSFMLKSSILDRMSGELCDVVTGDADSGARLDALEQQELFLLPLDEERQWFRYHHLFARFLQRRLKKQMPERIAALHLAASDWFARHGHTAEGVEHALLAEDTQRAVDLVERDAMALVENSSMSTLLNLVRKLPRTALFDRPHLQMAIAWANCLTHRAQEANEALWHVERVASSATPAQRALLLGEAKVLRACIDVYGDRIEGLEQLVRPCLDQAGEHTPWTVGVAANILAYRHIHTCELDKVGPLMQWARDYHERAQGAFASVYGVCFDGIAAVRAGQLSVARKRFKDAMDAAARSAGTQSNAARLASALLGQLLYEENDLGEAERLLRESRFLGFEGGVVDFYLATYLASCRLAMHRGDVEEALSILSEGEETARELNLERLGVAVACERVRVKLASGDIRGAELSLGEIDARRFAGAQGIELNAITATAKARLLCARGNPALACSILREQVGLAARSGWVGLEISLRLVLAIAMDQAGRAAEAEQALLDVISYAAPRGMVRTFLDEGAALLTILDRLRDRSRRRGGAYADAPTLGPAAQRLLSIARNPQHGIPNLPGSRKAMAELTAREADVLRLLDQGRANKEIARTLSISVDTVKWYLKSIFTKLGVSTRMQAITEARRRMLIGVGT